MINSYINSSKTLTTNTLLSFDINNILTGCTVTHVEGTPTFKLNKPGYYFVTFNGDAAGSAAAAGDITIQMLANGVEVPGATATETAAEGSTVNLSFSRIVKVLPSCCSIDNSQTLTFSNTGVGAIFSDANVVITKLC